MPKILNDLKVGDLVRFGRYTVDSSLYEPEPILWRIHSIYSNGNYGLITEYAIDCLAFDSAESKNSNKYRKNSGNNYYKYSNINQWLNSNKKEWYEKTHDDDSPPSSLNIYPSYLAYDSKQGFLYNFSTEERKLIKLSSFETEWINGLDNVGQSIPHPQALFYQVYLPSCSLFGNNPPDHNSTRPEDKASPYLSSNSYSFKGASPQLIDYFKQKNISYKVNTIWTRSPTISTECRVADDSWKVYYPCMTYHLSTKNTAKGIDCFYSKGIMPCIQLSNSTYVSNSPDEEGIYNILLEPEKRKTISFKKEK